MTKTVAALLVGLGLGSTASAVAQEAGRFKVIPLFGVVRYDRTSALSSIDKGFSAKMWPTAGLSAMYGVRSGVRVGGYLEAARPETSPDYYRYALLRTTGTYQLYAITQRVVVLQYGLAAQVDIPFARRLGPYLRGGVGAHSVYQDVQRSNTTKAVTGTEFSLGGGFNYSVSDAVAVRLELTDFMWSNWDRDELNTVSPAFQNTTFPEDNPPGVDWGKPSLIHNMRLAIGFQFTPVSGGTR